MATGPMSELVQRLRLAGVPPGGAELTDGQLLERYVGRHDEVALATLVRRHGPMVWGVCRRVLRNDHDAEDVFQATFLVLVRKAASIAQRELLANWLYGVAYQTALKARATAARRGTRERQVTAMPEPATVQRDLWNDVKPLLDQELNHLPDKYRAVIVLCDLEGKTRKEAARQLGCPEGTVAGRLARARVLLAKRLSRHGLTLSGASLAALLSSGAAAVDVPAAVLTSTIKVASLGATGQAAAAAVISARVASLTEGMVRAMLATKLKALTAMVLVVALLGGGGILVTARMMEEAPVRAKNAEWPPSSGKDSAKPKAEVDPKTDREKLQGTWTFVAVEEWGQAKEEDPNNPRRLVFDGNEFTIGKGRLIIFVGKFTLDPSQKPKAIDLEFTESVKPQDEGKTELGIYALEGDTLKLCLNRPENPERPKKFSANEKQELITLRRKRDKPDANPAKEEIRPNKKKPTSDKEALQGTWVGVAGARDGRELSNEEHWKLVFEENKVIFRGREGSPENEGTYTIDPDKKPREIDLTFGSKVLTGIYELKGDTLKTLWRENDRPGLPMDFDSQHGVLMIFERQK